MSAKRFTTHAASIAATMLGVAVSVSAAHAADPSCAALIKATTPDFSVPYRVKMTMDMNGQPSVTESVVIGGDMYILQPKATHWMKVKMPDPKVLVEQAQQSLTRCAAGGIEMVGTTPARTWTSQSVDPFTKKPMVHKVWIGVADGRVYRQKVDDTEQLISYTNISIPSPVKPDRKR
jgi:hypothetical protein